MSRYLHRRAGPCADLISSAFEMQSGYLGILWGIAVLLPGDMFSDDLVYSWLSRQFPEVYWGAFVLTAAVIQFSAGLCRMAWPEYKVRGVTILRTIASGVMTWAFLMISFNFLAGTYYAVSEYGLSTVSFRLMGALGYPMFLFENITSLLWLSTLVKGGK